MRPLRVEYATRATQLGCSNSVGPGRLVAWGGHAGGVFGERRCGEGTDANPVTVAGVSPRIVGVANCQSEVIECGHGVAVFGLKSRQKFRRG